MNKEELLKMAREADFEHFASAEAEWMDCSIDDLVSFANAILERAAVECENRVESVSMHATARDCANFNAGLYSGAASIRALKTENSV